MRGGSRRGGQGEGWEEGRGCGVCVGGVGGGGRVRWGRGVKACEVGGGSRTVYKVDPQSSTLYPQPSALTAKS